MYSCNFVLSAFKLYKNSLIIFLCWNGKHNQRYSHEMHWGVAKPHFHVYAQVVLLCCNREELGCVFSPDISSTGEYFCRKGEFIWPILLTNCQHYSWKEEVISVFPGNEDHSWLIENFQVLCSVVPSAFYYFPGKIIVATKAQKVAFPLPPKLEKLQDCKWMPGACKEAHCTCGMFMYKHLNSGLKTSTVLLYTRNLNLLGMSSTLRWWFSHLNVRLGLG